MASGLQTSPCNGSSPGRVVLMHDGMVDYTGTAGADRQSDAGCGRTNSHRFAWAVRVRHGSGASTPGTWRLGLSGDGARSRDIELSQPEKRDSPQISADFVIFQLDLAIGMVMKLTCYHSILQCGVDPGSSTGGSSQAAMVAAVGNCSRGQRLQGQFARSHRELPRTDCRTCGSWMHRRNRVRRLRETKESRLPLERPWPCVMPTTRWARDGWRRWGRRFRNMISWLVGWRR